MDVNQAYKITQYIVGKNIQNGYLSPDDFYYSINQAQNEYLDYLLGEYQQYQAGRPIAVVEIGQKEKVRNSIAPLIYNITLTPNTATGVSSYPSDYQAVDSMWTVYGGLYNIRFVNQPRLVSFHNSSIDLVNDNPIYLLKHEGFQFYPTNIGLAKMSYVRNPPSIVWGYVLDSNGNPVYNPATSQQPVWGAIDMMNIIARALRIIGVNLNAGEVAQYASQVQFNGQ
jgi:hypothetical protein